MDPITRTRATARIWGSTAQERALEFACDRFVGEPNDALYRALSVNAPPALLFRWLCQLRTAPYSYDWIDNLGRRSPRSLTPGLDRLHVGQRIMTVFQLAAFEPDRHITAVLDPGNALIGELAVTYLIVPEAEERCRLVVKVAVAYPRTPIGTAMRGLLPLGDLVMMRKQLLTLKKLAERDAASYALTREPHGAKARRRFSRCCIPGQPRRRTEGPRALEEIPLEEQSVR